MLAVLLMLQSDGTTTPEARRAAVAAALVQEPVACVLARDAAGLCSRLRGRADSFPVRSTSCLASVWPPSVAQMLSTCGLGEVRGRVGAS